MTLSQGKVSLGSIPPGLQPSQTLNVIQSLGPSYTSGDVQGVNAADLIVVIGRLTTLNRYVTLHKTVASTGAHTAGTDYQVPAGQQLIIGKVIFSGTAAANSIVLGYGDTGVATDNAAAPTNAVALTPADLLIMDTANKLYVVEVNLIVPASKYPFMYSTAGATNNVLCAGILRPS